MAAPCWRGELQAALERPGQDSVIALQDGKVSLSLNDLLTSSSWIARQVWGAPPATGSLEDSESMTAGKKTVAVYVDKSSTCVIASLGALLAGCRFVDIPATSRASEVVRMDEALNAALYDADAAGGLVRLYPRANRLDQLLPPAAVAQPTLLELLKGMLTLDPAERVTALEVRWHRFLDGRDPPPRACERDDGFAPVARLDADEACVDGSQ